MRRSVINLLVHILQNRKTQLAEVARVKGSEVLITATVHVYGNLSLDGVLIVVRSLSCLLVLLFVPYLL